MARDTVNTHCSQVPRPKAIKSHKIQVLGIPGSFQMAAPFPYFALIIKPPIEIYILEKGKHSGGQAGLCIVQSLKSM